MYGSARAAAILSAALLATATSCNNAADDDAWRRRHLFTTEGPIDPALALPVELPAGEQAIPLLVQFEGRVDAASREAVQAAGAHVRGYFPENALLVEANAAQAERLAAATGVRAIAVQKAAWRIDPRLRALPAETTHDVLVEIAEHDREAIVQAVAALGGSVIEEPAGWMLRAHLRGDRVEAMATVPGVRFVEQTPRFRTNNDEARLVLGTGSARVTANGLQGDGQIVAVADSGVDQASCFFHAGKIAAYEGAPEDESGHGTHVAGSIAGDRNGDGAADEYDGMAPGAQLFVQDVGSEDGDTLDLIPRDLGALLRPAYEAGARIHSDSWGTSTAVYGPTARSLDAFVAAHPDMLVLVASGNDGPDPGTVGNPAVAKNVIAVGASGTREFAGELAPFSSRGPSADGRTKPTLVAPGAAIFSAAAGADCAVTAMSGTSMATPVAAGAAALARQYFTDGWFPSGRAVAADGFAPSAALLRAVLIAGAVDLGAVAGEGAVPSDGQGFGRIDLGRSLWFAGEPEAERLWVVDEGADVALGEAHAWEVEVGEGGDLHVALAWTDRPGVSGAALALVQDLDLEVIAPDGSHYRGNGRADWDRDDVEEVVHLRDAAPGRYTVRVRGANLPAGSQRFALAVVGALGAQRAIGSAELPAKDAPGVVISEPPARAPDRAPQAKDDPVGDLARDAAAGCSSGAGAVTLAGFAAALTELRRRRR